MGSTCHGHGFCWSGEWQIPITFLELCMLQPDWHCFVLESKFREQNMQIYFCSREQPNMHTKILSLSLFHSHAAIILNSLGYQQHMTVLLNTVCLMKHSQGFQMTIIAKDKFPQLIPYTFSDIMI